MRERQKKRDILLSLIATLFLHSLPPVHSVSSLVFVCTRSGWKRLDCDSYINTLVLVARVL